MLATTTEVIKLGTRRQQAHFVRREMREEGMTVQDICDESGLSWITVARFADLVGNRSKYPMTRYPRLKTCQRIFAALGYDLVIQARKHSKGMVAL